MFATDHHRIQAPRPVDCCLSCVPLDRFNAIAPEWDDLARSRRGKPLRSPGWDRSAWWRSFQGGAPSEVLSVRGDGGLTGVLPVVHLASTLRSPTNAHTPIFGLLGRDEESFHRLALAVYSKRPRRLDMSFLPHRNAGFAELVDGARTSGMRFITRSIALSPYVDTTRGWSSYERTLDGKRLRELRRRRRRLEERGRLSLDVADGSERLESLLDEGFRLEASGWKAAYGTAIDSRPETRRFYLGSGGVGQPAADGLGLLSFVWMENPLRLTTASNPPGRHYFLKTRSQSSSAPSSSARAAFCVT